MTGTSSQISIGDELTLLGGSLKITDDPDGSLKITGPVTQTGGTFTIGKGNTAIQGPLTLIGGRLKVSPKVSGTLTISDNVTQTGGTLALGRGTTNISGTLALTENAVFTGTPDTASTLILNGNLAQSGGQATLGKGTTNISGTLTLSDGALTATTDISGVLSIIGDLAQSGGEFTGGEGQMTISGTLILSGGGLEGTVVLPGSIFNAPKGALDIVGDLAQTGGVFNGSGGPINISSTLALDGGYLTPLSSTLTISGNLAQTKGTFTGGDGPVKIGGNLVLSCTDTLSGTVTNPGGVFNTPSSELEIVGSLAQSGCAFNASDGTVAFKTPGKHKLTISTPHGVITFDNLFVGENVTLTTHAIVVLNGTLTNEGMTQEIADAAYPRPVNSTGTLRFGLADAILDIVTVGTLSGIKIERHDRNPPHAVEGIQTGKYWTLVVTGTGHTLNMTLPFDFPDASDTVCGYNEATQSWDCSADSFDPVQGTITRNQIPLHYLWTVGSDKVHHYDYHTYLPLTTKNYSSVPGPDLIVRDIIATSNNVQVVIQNKGNVTVTTDFWIDAYIAPAPPPTTVNQTWKLIAEEGLAWHITSTALTALVPSGVLTFTLNDLYYQPNYSELTLPLPVNTPIYAQVDSVNPNTNYGNVLENHEKGGGPYNNILGPVLSTE